MRLILAFLLSLGFIGQASANRPVSGVVAVSTGPMQAFSQVSNQAIGRDLTAGDNVFLNDEVETGKKTRAQVLLRDESVFSLAPSSKVVFDEFVFDPLAEEGVLEASLVKGGMRFVSGKLAQNKPENIKIKAGKATVGIRGTEIMATLTDKGSTFVLLSGAMEIATEGGRQIIDRSGFGIDVTLDGILGAVREIPLAEINAILSPPEDAQEGDDGGDDEASEEADAEESDGDSEGEAEAESEGESDSASSEAEAESESAASAEPAANESSEESDSSFDSAIASAAGDGQDGGGDTMAAVSVDIGVEPSVSAAPAPAEAVSAIVESLAEDSQSGTAASVVAIDSVGAIDNVAVTLNLSQNSVSNNPYFSSDAKLLIRAHAGFIISPAEFGVTRDLLREKFPEASASNLITTDGFEQVDDVSDSSIDLADYDAIFMYLNDSNTVSSSEQAVLQEFIASGKAVLTIGEVSTPPTVINSALAIYSTTETVNGVSTTYSYSAAEMGDPNSAIYDMEHRAALRTVSTGDEELLAGVDTFNGLYEGGGDTPYLDITRNSGSAPEAITNGLLEVYGEIEVDGGQYTISLPNGGAYQAVDFGAQGSAFFGSFSCGADSSAGSMSGASVSLNAVSTGRTQFCRNMISSIAPAQSLVDVEVGRLEAVGESGQVSFELNNHTDIFRILGDRLLLRKGATPTGQSYNLAITSSFENGESGQGDVTVFVSPVTAETRIISSRDTVRISNGSTNSADQTVIIDEVGLQTELADIAWISVGAQSTPTETGILTLHYRDTLAGETYDRFKQVEVVYDCTSNHCTEFATSMDTLAPLEFGKHFTADDFVEWGPTNSESFFSRFSTGTGSFALSHSSAADTNDYSVAMATGEYQPAASHDINHALTINYGERTGTLTTTGSFNNEGSNSAAIDLEWANFSFDSGPVQELNLVGETISGINTGDSYVNLVNLSLPNGKSTIAAKTHLYGPESSCNSDCRFAGHGYTPMKPQ